jgi:RNA-binding protein NOB1
VCVCETNKLHLLICIYLFIYFLGCQYSIPKPVGGRKNNDLILREDQYLEQLRKHAHHTRSLHSHADPFEMEFQFGDQRDTQVSRTGRAVTNHHGEEIKIGVGRRNPNEVRRRGKGKRH